MADMKLPEGTAESVPAPVNAVDFRDLNDFLLGGVTSSIDEVNEDFWSTLFTMQRETY